MKELDTPKRNNPEKLYEMWKLRPEEVKKELPVKVFVILATQHENCSTALMVIDRKNQQTNSKPVFLFRSYEE